MGKTIEKKGMIRRKDLTGFRAPTEFEKTVIWNLCGKDLIHHRKWCKVCAVFTVGFAALLVLTLIGHVLFLRTETVVEYLIFAAVTAMFCFMAKVIVKSVKDTGASAENIHNGNFQVLDVYSADFDPNIESTRHVGSVHFYAPNGTLCADNALINLDIAKKYRGKNKIPLLYVWEPEGGFYKAYAKEELRQFGTSDGTFYGI